MALERTALDHACNVIRRQVQDEFRDLTLLFVVHKNGEIDKAVMKESGAILAYPDGKSILRVFKKAEKTHQGGFLGLITGTHKGPIPFMKRDHLYGLFLIDADLYENLDVARMRIYHMIWHALDLREAFLSHEQTSFVMHDHLVVPRDNALNMAEKNLIADVFTSLLLEMQDKGGGSIKKMAAWRAMNTLTPMPGYEAEHYPFPVAMETTQLVYEDLKDSLDPKLRLYSRAIQLAKEVGMTHDAQSIRQWHSFSYAAQEMAWSNHDPETILSAAIFASEDPYVKTTAYLVSEAIDIKSQSLANIDIYNPFAEPETNERFHRKACEALFQATLAQALPMYESTFFMKEAQRQLETLMRGDILGWCGHALLNAMRAFEDAPREDVIIPTTLAFWESYNHAPWKSLQALSGDLMRAKRAGTDITRLDMMALLEKYPELEAVRECFSADPASLPAFSFVAKTVLTPSDKIIKPKDASAKESDFDFFSGTTGRA